MYCEGRQIFREAGMNLSKWKSNSKGVMKQIDEDEGEDDQEESSESYAEMILNPSNPSPVKVLGTPWDLEENILQVTLEKALERSTDAMTKVRLLSVSSSIFDVCGFLAPIVFFVKTLFQRVCKNGGSWKSSVSP